MGPFRAKWEAEDRKPGLETKNEVLTLPNQMKEEDNKALSVRYLVEEDKFYVMASVNFSRRKKKMRMGQNLQEEEGRRLQIP